MSAGVLLALSGPAEADLLAALAGHPDLQVVRRCADAAELVAAAVAGLGSIAVVDDDQDVDRRTIARMHAAGTSTVVLCHQDECGRYAELGALAVARGIDPIPAVLALAQGATELAVPDAVSPDEGQVGHEPDPGQPMTRAARRRARVAPRVLAVTGSAGAPGRTSLAIAVADELAAAGAPTLLIDADLWGGSIAQTLGLVAESAGLSAAIRSADRGNLDAEALDRLIVHLPDGLQVLTGIARATRWREIGPESVDVLIERAKARAAWVVVEAPVFVPDDEVFDMGPGRNAVAHAILAAADEVLVVGAAEPIGIQRMVQTLLDLDDMRDIPRRRAIVNRLRLTAAGPNPDLSVREALGRFAGVSDPVLIPDDRALTDKAVLTAATWRQAGANSPARVAVRELVQDLMATAGYSVDTGRRRKVRLPWRRAGRRAAVRKADQEVTPQRADRTATADRAG